MLRRCTRLPRNLRGFSTSSPNHGRIIRLKQIPEQYANHAELSRFPLGSLKLQKPRRIAVLQFIDSLDADSFVTSVLPEWSRLGAKVTMSEEASISPKIPAAILLYGLTRSLKIYHPQSIHSSRVTSLFPRLEPTESITEGNLDGQRYVVLHFCNAEGALSVCRQPCLCGIVC